MTEWWQLAWEARALLVTLLLHAHHDGDGGDVAGDDGDFLKTSIVSVSSLVVGCDFDIKNKLHLLVVWLLVVATLHKNQHHQCDNSCDWL